MAIFIDNSVFDSPINLALRETVVELTETNRGVANGFTILNEIPRRLEALDITDGGVTLTEIRDANVELANEQYRVSYTNGFVYFNPDFYADGYSIDEIKYTGRGVITYGASRIINAEGDPLSLGSLINVYSDGILVKNLPKILDFRQNIDAILDPSDPTRVIINVDPDAGFAGHFLDLSDAPSTYVGQSLKLTGVNLGETGIEFIDVASIPEIIDHEARITTIETDIETPLSDESVPYAGLAGKYAESKDALSIAIHGINLSDIKDYKGGTLTNLALGSFETDVTTTGIGDGWIDNNSLPTFTLDNTIKRVGNFAQKIVSGANDAIQLYSLQNFVSGKKYFIKGYAYITSMGTDGAVVGLDLRVLSGATTKATLTFTTTDSLTLNEWVEVSTVYTADGTEDRLMIRSSGSSGDINNITAYIDEVSFIPVDNTILDGLTAVQIANRITYIEGQQSVGSPVDYDQLLDNLNKLGNTPLVTGITIDTETDKDGVAYYKIINQGATTVVTANVGTITVGNKYTLFTHVIKNTETNDTAVVISGSGGIFGTEYVDGGFIGIDKRVLTADSGTGLILGSGSLGTAGAEVIMRQILIEGDHTNVSDETALKWIQEQDFGVFEVKGIFIESIEKNKFNKLTTTENLRFTGVGDATTATTNSFISDFIKVIGGQDYFKSPHIADSRNYVAYYDNDKNVIGNAVITDAISPTVDGYIRVGWYTTSLDTAQIQLGTSFDTYEDFIKANAHINEEFGDVPNGVADDFDFERIKKHYILTEDDITVLDTSWTNFDAVKVQKSVFIGYKSIGVTSIEDFLTIYPEYDGVGTFDDTSNIGKVTMQVSSTFFYLALVPKGTYATLADAKTDLAGTEIQYQLATPLPRDGIKAPELDITGKLLTSVDATFTQESTSGITNYFTTDVPLNLYGQLLLNILTDLSQQKEINWNKAEILKLIIDTQSLIDDLGYAPDLETTAKVVVEAINELKTAVDLNTAKNSYPSADAIKLAGIEANATIDQTGAEIKLAYEAESDTNAFTDALKTKLEGLSDMTDAEIKTAYENNADTNAYTDLEKTQVSQAKSKLVYTAGTDGLAVETAITLGTSTTRTMSTIAGANYLEITIGSKSSGTIFDNKVMKFHFTSAYTQSIHLDYIDDYTGGITQFFGQFGLKSSATEFGFFLGVKYVSGTESTSTDLKIIKIVAFYDN